jgi:hypothetical protein
LLLPGWRSHLGRLRQAGAGRMMARLAAIGNLVAIILLPVGSLMQVKLYSVI